jgi:hypothetical protein
MPEGPKVVMVKLNENEMNTLLVEQVMAAEAEQVAASLSEGTTRISWGLINWAKAQMTLRPN